jgi:hypothetical protein
MLVVGSLGLDSVLLTEDSIWIPVMRFESNSLIKVGAPNFLVAKCSSDYRFAEGPPNSFLSHCIQALGISSKDLIPKK